MDARQKVQAVLKSEDSAYQIQKLTNVNSSIIIRLRNHTRSVDNLSLGTVEKLERYFDYHVKHENQNMPSSAQLSHFRHRLINLLQELYQLQQAKSEAVDALPDEKAMTAAIERLFNDVIANKLELEHLETLYSSLVSNHEELTGEAK